MKPNAEELYAGGIDSTAVRCLLRKNRLMSWTLGVTDIKTAFKLAPRKETRYLLVTTPPRVLVDCNICDESERWIVLETSPADWADFRDMKVQTFRWTLEGRHFKLMRTAEPNLWRVVSSGDALFTEERTEGFCIDYVDDISAKEDVVRSAMARLQEEWTCSEPEYLSDKGMVKFFGVEIESGPKGLLSQNM